MKYIFTHSLDTAVLASIIKPEGCMPLSGEVAYVFYNSRVASLWRMYIRS